MKKIPLIIMWFLLTIACRLEAAPRIVSLAPNTTEILFSLGLGDSIVGVDNFSNYPEGVKDIEKLGTFNNPNVERIISLRPDYILVNSGLDRSMEDYLTGLGVKVIKVSPKTIEGLYSDIIKLGAIFNKEEKAEGIVRDMRSRIANISRNAKGVAPKVFIQLFDDPLITASSFISDVIRLAGGENIARDIKDDAGIFSYEALIDRNPDIILTIGFSSSDNLPGVISAVKNKKVYRNMDPDIVLRPGPRAIEAIELLNRLFYE